MFGYDFVETEMPASGAEQGGHPLPPQPTEREVMLLCFGFLTSIETGAFPHREGL